MITYEYPFSERIRTLLRLEVLFGRTSFFIAQSDAGEHHAALLTLFEVLDVLSRGADLKTDLIQELERQRQSLLAFRSNPEISEEALSGALYEIEQASTSLLAMTGKIGQYLRENDWLMGIKSRAIIPGGVCEFDLPSYHFWKHQDSEARRENLSSWLNPLLPLRDGIAIVLRLLRACGHFEPHVAKNGAFQLMLGGSGAQLVRVALKRQWLYVPEISANKYALNIRFVNPGSAQRQRQPDTVIDVPFEIAFCNL